MNVNRLMLALTLGLLAGCSNSVSYTVVVDEARAQCAARGGIKYNRVFSDTKFNAPDVRVVTVQCKDETQIQFEVSVKEG